MGSGTGGLIAGMVQLSSWMTMPPPLEDDPADAPDPRAECASPLRRQDLHDSGVGAIVWATGFTADFG